MRRSEIYEKYHNTERRLLAQFMRTRALFGKDIETLKIVLITGYRARWGFLYEDDLKRRGTKLKRRIPRTSQSSNGQGGGGSLTVRIYRYAF